MDFAQLFPAEVAEGDWAKMSSERMTGLEFPRAFPPTHTSQPIGGDNVATPPKQTIQLIAVAETTAFNSIQFNF